MAKFEKLLKTVFYQDAPQCSACNRAAVTGGGEAAQLSKGAIKKRLAGESGSGRELSEVWSGGSLAAMKHETPTIAV
jgi:hypothetical protein